LPNIPEVRSFQSLIRAIDADKEAVFGLQSMVNAKIKAVEGFGNFVSKWVPGGEALVGKVSEKIGGIAIKEFLKGSMEVLAKEGLVTGAKTIMQSPRRQKRPVIALRHQWRRCCIPPVTV
jgi:hypothetical protein